MTLAQNPKFDFVFLGQSILKYEVPLDIFTTINSIYQNNFDTLDPANKQLIGKIQNEHSLFYGGKDESKMKNHNKLTQDVIKYFMDMFRHYLNWNRIESQELHLNSIWVNEMKEHEYNPVHIHQGTLYTGLSSVMILKLPKETGIEYSASDTPMNGQLQILGSASGQFAHIDYGPTMEERNFYVFPYDMRHCVYPFNGSGFRRTLACNMDVDYDPIKNIGVS